MDDDDETSLSLLRRTAESNSDAWAEFAATYSPYVYRWCRRVGLGPEDSADVMQEVFRTLVTSLSRFQKDQPNHKFRSWLWTITCNKIRDHQRAQRGKPRSIGGTDAHLDLLNIPDWQLDESETAASRGSSRELVSKLASIRGDFAEQTWQAFCRVTVDGISAARVADELGISIDSVYQAKSRVLKRLRTELGPDPDKLFA